MTFLSGLVYADPYKEQRTGIEFPDSVGDYKRGKVTPYNTEPGNDGIAIEYSAHDSEVTIYVRRLGNDDEDKGAADFVKEAIAGVKVLESQGKYSNVKIYESDPAKERPGWRSAAFTASTTNRFLMSFIHCRITSGQLVKVRASTGNPTNELLQTFTKSLQEIIDRPPKKPGQN